MRLLYLMSKAPLPDNSGDAKRNLALLEAARTVADELHLITLPQAPGPGVDEGLAALAQLCDRLDVVGSPIADHMTTPANRVRAIVARSYFEGVGSHPAVRGAVHEALAAVDYDVIVVSQLFIASAVPPQYADRVVYDSHNVHDVRLAEALSTSRLQRLVARPILRRVHEQETRLVATARVTLACSPAEAAVLAGYAPGARVEVVPNGARLDEPDVPLPARTVAQRSVLFLASLDYKANIESLAWFVDEVVPGLGRDVEVRVAGSNPKPQVHEILARSAVPITFLGHVEDAAATMREAGVLVIPLINGSGTRLKALEAFAEGLPVVSTPKGVEGLDVVDGVHALLATSPAGLAAHVTALAGDLDRQNQLRADARELLRDRFTWPAIRQRFVDVLDVAPKELTP